ncbi:PIN domain-containing protein [Candidatus Woesearchaeota archaeon]|nr:PIN domain-containing protein [Candidatus Woesearchaeota archaeon]
MILDTSFLIDLMKHDSNALDRLRKSVKINEPQLITSISIFELFSGIQQSSKTEQEKKKIRKVLKDQIVVPLDEKAAEKAGEIHGKLIKLGKRIESGDCLIAGIAITKKQKLLTRNIKHFSRIDGLEIDEY